MKYWIGVTDNRWFEFLSNQELDEINFWQPSAIPLFSSLAAGTPFLFKLKRPYNHIAGGAFFVKYSTLPLSLAWDAFGEKNGARSISEVERLIQALRSGPITPMTNIGCTILSSPFFFPKEAWIPAPSDWSGNIVRGKTYDTSTPIGSALWDSVKERLALPDTPPSMAVMEQPAEYGEPFLTRARLGQGTFRVLVTDAYGRQCAITGENILPVLEAAHIKPFSKDGPNNACNGLLLRSDFHKLFDVGFVTVTPDLRVEVSSRIREEWFNGKAYYRLHGKSLAVKPQNKHEQPKRDYLEWHNEHVFQG